MKIIHDGTRVLNETACGYDPKKYPRLNKHGKPLPGHGYYILDKSDDDQGSIWDEIFKKRDEFLRNIEISNNENISKKQKDAIARYRKNLEDIATNFEKPEDVIWPDIPVTINIEEKL